MDLPELVSRVFSGTEGWGNLVIVTDSVVICVTLTPLLYDYHTPIRVPY